MESPRVLPQAPGLQLTPRTGPAAAAALLALGLAVPGASPAQEILRTPFEEVPAGTFGLGGGELIDRRLYISDGNRHKADVVPLYLYEGKRLFAHGTTAGIHLLDSESLALDLLGRYRLTWFEPADENIDGLLERQRTLDAGISATWRGGWGELNGKWLADTLGRHDGQTAELNYRFPFDLGRWSITPWASWEWQSSALTRYYFGVTPGESEASGFAAYRPGDAYNIGWGVNASYPLTENIQFFANAGQTWLDDEIGDSPITDTTRIDTVFVGANYLFRTPGPGGGSSGSRDGSGLWSWRVNGGYAAEGNIVGEISVGDIRRSKDADTPIAGFTVGRIVRPGPRVDIYAKGAIFRHFEDGLQDNFFSYAAYIMAVGKGYLPWSDQESFRFGFGYGLSYADQIPILEEIKQEKDGERTSHLLTYLELTVDFPLKNFFRAASVRDCYAGTTIVHRSGIFGSATFLGSVHGGSNWVTLHLECKR
ncbi:MAG: MipA/OmpV family protein [Gammaproteobacteria bacterium]